MLQVERLIRRLRPKLGLHRLDAQAVRLDRAVAAALADQLVDDGEPRRVLQRARACAGGASRWRRSARRSAPDARDLAQLALHARRARGGGGCVTPRGKSAGGRTSPARRRRARSAPRPRRGRLCAIAWHADRAVDRLPAGHRDGVVVEDLVGDVGARRDRLADRHRAGVVPGALAEVLEDVAAAR